MPRSAQGRVLPRAVQQVGAEIGHDRSVGVPRTRLVDQRKQTVIVATQAALRAPIRPWHWSRLMNRSRYRAGPLSLTGPTLLARR